MYAGTSDTGVFKSTDGGAWWSAIRIGLSSPCISVLVNDPTTSATVYAGAYEVPLAVAPDDGGVYKSTNGGRDWIAPGQYRRSQVTALAVDPVSPNILYASANNMFKSTDGGVNWAASYHGLPVGNFANALAIATLCC